MLGLQWHRAGYLVLFFCNAVFATLFRSIGDATLGKFGTFGQCDASENASCRGNQMVFRSSFCISAFFAIQVLASRFGSKTRAKRCVTYAAISIEFLIYAGLLIGCFFIPSGFFNGYAKFARIVSGLFILFQIVSIVGVSYDTRDYFLDRIANAETSRPFAAGNSKSLWDSPVLWKLAFLGFCFCSFIAAVIGLAYLYVNYGQCGVGMAFTTVTAVAVAMFIAVCVLDSMDVGLLPPCVVSAYLALMCWQALTSAPKESCQGSLSGGGSFESDSTGSVVANAIIASFAVTWTSWRSSSAASSMFSSDSKKQQQHPSKTFTSVVVLDAIEHEAPTATENTSPPTPSQPHILRDTWQFHCMMLLASIYMSMVLTDWNSADKSSNGTSMWVKIGAQWLTMLLFAWSLAAPKLFPNRDFT